MSTQYTLIFQNNSTLGGDACVYQTDPEMANPQVMSLAWFSKYAYPTTQLQFQWSIDYDFVWGNTGTLAPGVVFSAAQVWPTDPNGENQVTFSYDPANQAYFFENQRTGGIPGNLYIDETGIIPVGSPASVGIGMSGFGTFAMQAQPNYNLTFSPHPEYWITFGTFTQGEVLDITNISNPAKIEFPNGVYSMTAILNQDNSWTIMPTSSANAALLDARKQDSKALFAGREALV